MKQFLFTTIFLVSLSSYAVDVSEFFQDEFDKKCDPVNTGELKLDTKVGFTMNDYSCAKSFKDVNNFTSAPNSPSWSNGAINYTSLLSPNQKGYIHKSFVQAKDQVSKTVFIDDKGEVTGASACYKDEKNASDSLKKAVCYYVNIPICTAIKISRDDSAYLQIRDEVVYMKADRFKEEASAIKTVEEKNSGFVTAFDRNFNRTKEVCLQAYDSNIFGTNKSFVRKAKDTFNTLKNGLTPTKKPAPTGTGR